jgi:TfoX/Sxy family transcriptional regulator of competence genes
MAYNEALADRIRERLRNHSGITERKMFGGIAFMVNGNMVCGIVRDELMVRVGAANHDEALGRPHARPMDFTGRPMKGMVFVAPAGFSGEDDLRSWIELGLNYAASLPPRA